MLIIAVFLGLCTQQAHAQEVEKYEEQKSWSLYQSELSRIWKIQNEFLKLNDNYQGNQLFDQLLFLEKSYEINQIPALSKAFLRKIPPQKSISAMQKHPYFTMADQLSPNHYSNDYFLCNFHVETTEWPTALKYCFEGLRKELSEPSGLLVFLSKISYQVLWTMTLVILFYLILYTIKFLPFSIQYYSANFYWISPISFFFLALAILFLVLSTFGWLFFFGLIFIFLWRFPSAREKGLLFIILCMVMALPFTFVAPALSMRYNKNILSDLFNAESSLQPQKYVEHIKDYILLHPKESYALFTLGVLEKKIGNLQDAKMYFEKSRQIQPLFSKTHLNLANLQYQMGDSDGAKEEYKKLIQQYPDLMSAYINISQIYTHESQYLQGEDYMTRAKRIDENRFKELSKTLHNRDGSIKLIYEVLSLPDISENIYQTNDTFKPYFQQFFSYYFPNYSPKLFYASLFVTLILSLLLQYIDNTRSFFLLYSTREKNIENLTLVQLKEYPKAYKKYAGALDRREMIKAWFAHLFPGVQAFIDGNIILSFVLCFSFFFFLTGYLIEIFGFRSMQGFPWSFVCGALLILVFLTNLVMVRIEYVKKKN